MATSKKLEMLIHSLELVNDNPNNKKLGSMIAVLKKISVTPKEKAEVENNDNKLAGYILCIIALNPEILHHSKNSALKKFCGSLKPAKITNVPVFIWEILLGNTLDYTLTAKSRANKTR